MKRQTGSRFEKLLKPPKVSTLHSEAWRSAAWVTAVLCTLLVGATSLQALTLEVVDAVGTPKKFSAHASQELCFFIAVSSLDTTLMTAVTFKGHGGEIATKPALAGGDDPVCFTAPAIPDAGRWRGCTEPRDVIPEAYRVSAAWDETGAPPAEAERVGEVMPAAFVFRVERQVTAKEPRPKECQDLDGEWTWTFGAGTLQCDRLPMPLTLPGFSDSVSIVTDGEGLEGLRMTVSGGSKRERVVLVRQADVRRGGQDLAFWKGSQDISGLLDQSGEIPGKYSLVVKSDRRLEGDLEVKRVRVEEDVCSIAWPFQVTR